MSTYVELLALCDKQQERIAELEFTLRCAIAVFNEYEMNVDDYPTKEHKSFISAIKDKLREQAKNEN